MNGNLAKHFAVKLNFIIFQFFNENGIASLERLKSGVDADNPQSADIAAAKTSADISVLTRMHDSFTGGFESLGTSHPKTLGLT